MIKIFAFVFVQFCLLYKIFICLINNLNKTKALTSTTDVSLADVSFTGAWIKNEGKTSKSCYCHISLWPS